MAKIETNAQEITPLARAHSIRAKILIDEQIHRFVDFVHEGYLKFCDTKRKQQHHLLNRDRDTAIESQK